MPDHSIRIEAAASQIGGAPAQFVPRALAAQEDDLVSWNNTTGEPHHPWPTDAAGKPLPDDQVSPDIGNYLSDEIPAYTSSKPAYDVVMPQSGNIIYYCCKLHPEMRGTITVAAIPSAPVIPR